MEDEDFGFTRREERVLKKVAREEAGRGCEGEEGRSRTDDVEKNWREENSRSAGAEGFKKKVEDAGSVIPDEYEGVSTRHEADGSEAGNKSIASNGTSPETGNEQPNKLSTKPETSVNPQTPNIPNVVEYHLKIKTSDHARRPTDRANANFDNKTNESDTKEKMRSDPKIAPSSRTETKSLTSKLSMLSIDKNVFEGSTDLPQVFQVKYLGSHDARGLWGIKHTRKPVDNMVASAKSLPANTILPLVKLVVSKDGVSLLPIGKRKHEAGFSKMYPIESISYGVQDLVYTRVFSMIVVRDNGNFRRVSPFECHAFVCESKHHARQLTYALAAAFQIYSENVKTLGTEEDKSAVVKKRFAIDLRSPDEIETELTLDSEA